MLRSARSSLAAKHPLPAETTVFKSVGLAVEDIAAARLVVEAYERREHRS